MSEYQEALERLERNFNLYNLSPNDYEVISKLVDKETPIKPIRIGEQDNIFSDTCRNCKEPIVFINNYLTPKRCIDCGQKLDWSVDE